MDVLNEHTAKRMGHTRKSCYSLHGFPDKGYPGFLMRDIKSI